MGAWLIPGIASGFFKKFVNVTEFAKFDLCGKCCPGSLWVPEGSGPARPVGQAREESPWMLLLGVEPDTRTPTEARAATTEARSMLIVIRQKIPVYEEN